MGARTLRGKGACHQPPKIARFYRSDEWHLARAIKIADRNGICERCGRPGNEVHHIVHLTVRNVDDPGVALNQANLMLLCTECHNKEHHRFGRVGGYAFDAEGNLVRKDG